jgi:hypothetical protein
MQDKALATIRADAVFFIAGLQKIKKDYVDSLIVKEIDYA